MRCLHTMSSIPNYPKCFILPCSGYKRSISLCPFHTMADGKSQRFLQKLMLCFDYSPRQRRWTIRSSMTGDSDTGSSGSGSNGGPRLLREIETFRQRISTRFQALKKNWPLKVLLFLVGFYCATAFATFIGQTGDWDILSAGLAVVVVEVMGVLVYRSSLPFAEKIKRLISMFNYWKAGLSMGLFLDAFKYEMDDFLESCDPFRSFMFDVTDIFSSL
ncbi:YCF20-like protein (DUF565) [Wolffia australiana]